MSNLATALGRCVGESISARGARMPSSGSVVMASTHFGSGFALGFWEVEAGDLETIEEEAGAARIDFVGGDALENCADGGLDAGAIVGIGERQVEGGAAALALARVGNWFSGCVVVVAEFFAAQTSAAAAMAVGEDVTALEAFWCSGFDDGVLQVSPPTGFKVYKVFKRNDLSLYFVVQVFGSSG